MPDIQEKYQFIWQDHYYSTPHGRMHYVDKGSGPVLLFLHGNPTWSFMYRRFIAALSNQYRCIAPDYLGFGLSDKPHTFSYRPEDHAEIIARFISDQVPDSFTLIVHDWGGPIGLSYALENPERIDGIIVFNSWMWSLASIPRFKMLSALHAGWLGEILTRRLNLFVKFIMPAGFARYDRVTPGIRAAYRHPFQDPQTREGVRVFPEALMASDAWLRSLWAKRSNLSGVPALILWGMQDRAFRTAQLNTWSRVFAAPKVHRLENIGHYAPEESGELAVPVIQEFIRNT
ncbi:MAG: alpha/beta fold hydrolase [Candidatus Marinimicrobia bacterium]|nr:alpha/beta fold hydrolase [Candidatus Neomarinimicrobiota bacterium]